MKMHGCSVELARAEGAPQRCQKPIMLGSLTASLPKAKERPPADRHSCSYRFAQLLTAGLALFTARLLPQKVPVLSPCLCSPNSFIRFLFQLRRRWCTLTTRMQRFLWILLICTKKCANLDKPVTPFCRGNRESLSVKHKRIIILYSSKEKIKQDYSVIPSEEKEWFLKRQDS